MKTTKQNILDLMQIPISCAYSEGCLEGYCGDEADTYTALKNLIEDFGITYEECPLSHIERLWTK